MGIEPMTFCLQSKCSTTKPKRRYTSVCLVPAALVPAALVPVCLCSRPRCSRPQYSLARFL